MRTIHDNHHLHGHPHGKRIYACPVCKLAFRFVDLVNGPRVPPHQLKNSFLQCDGVGLDLVRAKEKT